VSQLPDLRAHGFRALEVLGANPESGRIAYRGVRLADEQPVVIKRFSFASGDASWESYASHARELEMLAGLDHPQIPAFLEDFQTDDGFCMVLEFCPAPPMSSRQHWTPDQLYRLALSTLEVLVYLQDHTPPVVHRDIKPDNILVDDDGTAFLVDFGLARADRAQATTVAVGTPGFMAPEQLLGHELTTGTDLYGLGASLVSALTGTSSADIGSLVDSTFTFDLSRLPANLTPEFRDWLTEMVAPGLKDRFGSAREAKTILERALNIAKPQLQQPRPRQSATDTSTSDWTTRQKAGAKRFQTLLGGAVIVAAIGGGVFMGLVEEDVIGGDDAADEGIYCDGEMTITESLTMKQQRSPIQVEEGCDVTVKNATFKGVVGLKVKTRAKVRLENVTIETSQAAIHIDHPDAQVTVVKSRLRGGTGLRMSKGAVLIEDSTLDAKTQAISLSGGTFAVTGSSLSGGDSAASLYRSEGTFDNTVFKGGRRGAIRLRNGSDATLEGGSVTGGVYVDDSSTLAGLDTAKLNLGASAGATWAQSVCKPVLVCIKGGGMLGEFVADLRVPIGADGSAGPPEFVQKKLHPKQENCILESLEEVRVPGPDGKPHTVRCTTSGNVMAGGGGMTSVDFKLEQ